MGISARHVEVICAAVKSGVKLESVCMLGRQNFFGSIREARRIIRNYGIPAADVNLPPAYKGQQWADDVFRLLGTKTITSIDASGFEDAAIVHDLNTPLPNELQNRFDFVLDGGTLEHIFNFPVALKNAMQLVREGGSLMISTPANNLCGHGFYQLSPELFWRALSPENGYRIRNMLIFRNGRFYEVADPKEVRSRVMLVENKPAMLEILAERIDASVEIFAVAPQQSDYEAAWSEADSDPGANDGRLKGFLRRHMTQKQIDAVSAFLQPIRQRRAAWKAHNQSNLSNRRFYKPINLDKLS